MGRCSHATAYLVNTLAPSLRLQLDASVDLEEVARRTEGFSCADIRGLCREAAMQPLRRLLKKATPDAVQQALCHNDVRARAGAGFCRLTAQAANGWGTWGQAIPLQKKTHADIREGTLPPERDAH